MLRWLCWLLIPACGCVSPGIRAPSTIPAPEHEHADASELPGRSRVHVFIINGSDPFVSMTPLVSRLNDAGFTKVSVGGIFYSGMFERMIREAHAADPEARFILAGYGLGMTRAEAMTYRLHQAGIAVDALIAMSPIYLGSPAPLEVKRVVVRARPSPLEIVQYKAFAIPDASSIAKDEAAHELILSEVVECCRAVPAPPAAPVAALPLLDDPAPLPKAPPLEIQERRPLSGTLTSQPK